MPAVRFDPGLAAASSAVRGNRHIVDQPRPADPGRDEQPRGALASFAEPRQALGVGQLGIIDAGATAIRRITASCCQSFSPNTARSGRTWLNSLATTVATPSKCPGRDAPSSPSL